MSGKTGAGIWLTNLRTASRHSFSRSVATDAVNDDARLDDDHAHEAEEVGRELGRGVGVAGTHLRDIGRLEVGDDIRQARQHETDEAEPDEAREAGRGPPDPF